MATEKQTQATMSSRIFAEDNNNKGGKFYLLQLVLSYFFHISCVLSFLLIFGAETKRLRINRNFLNRSGKLIVPFLIIIRYRCFIIHPHINSFIARIRVWLGFWYFPFSDFLPIYGQNGLPTRPRLTPIKDKLVLNSMLATRNGLGGCDVSVFKAEIVIFMMKLAGFHI